MSKLSIKSNVENPNTILVTHMNCWDGTGCIVVFLSKYPDGGVLETGYGMAKIDEYINLLKGKDVIIADFSFPKADLLKLKEVTNSIIVIDHHETAKEDLEDLEFCTFDMNKCGAHLLWESFYKGIEVPEWVKLVEVGDLYKTEDPMFDAWRGFRIPKHSNRLEALTELSKMDSKDVVEKVRTEGMHSFDTYMTLLKESVLHHTSIFTLEVELENGTKCKIPAVYAPTVFSSDAGNELAKMSKHSVGATLSVRADKQSVVVSFRSVGDGLASEFAKSLGGGGHKKAAGSMISYDKAITMIRANNDWKL